MLESLEALAGMRGVESPHSLLSVESLGTGVAKLLTRARRFQNVGELNIFLNRRLLLLSYVHRAAHIPDLERRANSAQEGG